MYTTVIILGKTLPHLSIWNLSDLMDLSQPFFITIFERFISVTFLHAWPTIHTMSNKNRFLNMQDTQLLENLFISGVHQMPCPFPGASRDFWIALYAIWKCLPWNGASSKLLITRTPILFSSLWNAIKCIAPHVKLPSLSDCLSLFLPRHHRGQVWADLLCGWHHDQADWSEWDYLNCVGFQWLDICSTSQLWLCYGHFSGNTVGLVLFLQNLHVCVLPQ